MYRQRIRQQVLYGQFREYMEAADDLIARREALGLGAATLWAPVVGTSNEIVWELDYADLEISFRPKFEHTRAGLKVDPARLVI